MRAAAIWCRECSVAGRVRRLPPACGEVGLLRGRSRQFRFGWCVECLEEQGEVSVSQSGALVSPGQLDEHDRFE
jgi:hypothetical protein